MTPPAVLRRASRISAVVLTLTVPLASAHPALAGTPASWGDPEPMSLLEALLIFGGIPLALALGISVLVVAPSLVRGDRQHRGVASWTEPQWFGGPGDAVAGGRRGGELPSGNRADQAGGASARW
ncbi:MAG: hypothetical protein ACRDOY_12980 [Nocardioidaceae bacterium]